MISSNSLTYGIEGKMQWPSLLPLISKDQLPTLQKEQKDIKLHLHASDFSLELLNTDLELHVHFHKKEELSPEIINYAQRLYKWPDKKMELKEEDLPDLLLSELQSSLSELENKLAISEIRSSEFIEKNYNTILVRDVAGKIIYINEAIEKTIAYTPSELIGQNSNDFVHPEDLAKVKEALARIIEGEDQTAELKLRIKHRKGHYVWIQSQISDHRETPGIEGILSNFINIDEQQKAIFELEESNRRFKYSSRATQDVIWDWDLETNEIFWGENLNSIFGFQSEDVDSTEKFISKIHPEDIEAFDLSVGQVLNSDEDKWESHYRFKDKSSNYRFIIDRGYAQRNKEGKAIRLIGAMHDDTLRREYENQLKAEETKFRQIFEGSLIGMLMLDLKTLKFRDCNQSLLNILGYKKSEFLETSLKDLVPEKDYNYNLDQIRRLKEQNDIEPFQTTLIRKDLSPTTVIASASTSEHKNDRFAWIHVLDLGPIERSSLALAEAETRFRQYIEKSSDIFVTLNQEGKYEYASPNIEQLLGYRPSEIIGRDNLSMMHPDDVDAAAIAFKVAFEEPGKVTRAVFRAKHKRNKWIWVESNGRFEVQGGELKAYINVRDIQKEHEIESELRKLSLVANRTSNAVIITDANQKIDWVNESFTEMSGYSLEEARGQYLPNLLHGPLSRDIFSQKIEGLLRSEKPFKSQNVNYNKNGEHYWIESIVTPVFDANGKLSNYISIETDISQRIEEEATFKDYLKLITNQNEILRNLAHIITHNFRSHAGNIQQLIQEMKRPNSTNDLNTIQQFLTQSADSLMESLDETSAILQEKSENSLPQNDCDLNLCAQRVKQLLYNEIRKINAQVKIDIPKRQTIKAYQPYLDSVVFNLVSNALRYHDPEKKTEISIRYASNDSYHLVEVEDNGLGIDLKKYGNRLFRLRQGFHSHPESTGIGLYMIRAQIESLGGQIEVDSKPGVGSKFTAAFPK